MKRLWEHLVGPLLVAAILGLVAMYADVAVLKSQVKQLQHEQKYYHGDPIE